MNEILKAAVYAVVRPLVRYLIRQGWTFPALADLLRMAYVEEAILHYGNAGGSLTDSRISLLTGIHRKEVKRLRLLLQENPGVPLLRHGANTAAQVVAAWVSTPNYLDENGAPKPLPLHGVGQPSFAALVKIARADMRARTVLDELVKAGIVAVDADDRARLLRRAYLPDLPEDKLAFFADNLRDHILSATHNLQAGEPLLERAVYFSDVPTEILDTLRPEIYRNASRLLEETHGQISRMGQRKGGGRRRMRLGIYYYEEPGKTGNGEGGPDA